MQAEICFVHLENIMAIPYLHKYTNLIEEPFDIIYWNRRNLDEDCGASNYYALNYPIFNRTSKAIKVIGYFKFKAYATKILKQNKYKKVILLTGNVAVLLKGVLLNHYAGRYLIDIRDYFLENNRFYYRTEKQLIDRSAMAVISSEGFKSFLPEYDYVLVHNSPNLSIEDIDRFRKEHNRWKESRGKDSPVVLSFIGGVRFFEQDKRVLRYFSNDDRFFVRYIGAGAEFLRPYCDEIGMNNVYIHDRFSPEETLNFYKETNMILNLFGNRNPLVEHLLSNRLYYAAVLYIPILVCQDTYMENVSGKYGFGFALDLETPDCRNRLYAWYQSVQWNRFRSGCKDFMDAVRSDDKLFTEKVGAWFNK